MLRRKLKLKCVEIGASLDGGVLRVPQATKLPRQRRTPKPLSLPTSPTPPQRLCESCKNRWSYRELAHDEHIGRVSPQPVQDQV